MRKFLMTAIMSCLLFVGLTSMISMSQAADPYPNCQGDCDFLTGLGVFPSQGSCMSTCHTCTSVSAPGSATNAVCTCKFIKDVFGGLEQNGFKNFGQCVTVVSQIP